MYRKRGGSSCEIPIVFLVDCRRKDEIIKQMFNMHCAGWSSAAISVGGNRCHYAKSGNTC